MLILLHSSLHSVGITVCFTLLFSVCWFVEIVSLCIPRWLQTQRSSCLHLLSTGITSVYHHALLFCFYVFFLMIHSYCNIQIISENTKKRVKTKGTLPPHNCHKERTLRSLCYTSRYNGTHAHRTWGVKPCLSFLSGVTLIFP
jgi:hypothetical protein